MSALRSTRRQRRAVVAAWRAVPYSRRVEVVRLAKAGRRHPDEAAVEAAQRYADCCVSPGGRGSRRARVRRACTSALLPMSAVVGAEAVALHRIGAPGVLVGLVAAVAVAVLAAGVFWIDLLRESRRLLALPAAEAAAATTTADERPAPRAPT